MRYALWPIHWLVLTSDVSHAGPSAKPALGRSRTLNTGLHHYHNEKAKLEAHIAEQQAYILKLERSILATGDETAT